MKLLNGLTVGGEPASVGFQVINTTMEEQEMLGVTVPAALNVIMNSAQSDVGYVTLTEEEFESKFFKREGFIPGAYVFGDETMNFSASVVRDRLMELQLQQEVGIESEIYFIKPMEYMVAVVTGAEMALMIGIPAFYMSGSWMVGEGVMDAIG